jgi:hypothetical protein
VHVSSWDLSKVPLGFLCIAARAKHRWRAPKRQVFRDLQIFLRSFNVAGDSRKRISNYWLLFTFVNEMMCARYAPSTSQARAVINYLEFLALTLAWRKKAAAFRLCSVRWALVRAFCIGNLYLAANNNLLSRRLDWWLCSLPFASENFMGLTAANFVRHFFLRTMETRKSRFWVWQ